MKKIIALFLALIFVFAFAACSLIPGNSSSDPDSSKSDSSKTDSSKADSSKPDATKAPEPTTSSDQEIVLDEIKITLPADFTEHNEMIPDDSDIKYFYANGDLDVAFVALSENKSDFEGTKVTSLEDYLEVQHDNSKGGDNTSEIKEDNGLKYFDYEAEGTNGTIYKYFSTAFESDDYYWFVQFYTSKEQYSKYESKFLQWSRTVTEA